MAPLDPGLRRAFGLFFVVLILLQKFAITLGGLQLSLTVPALYLLLGRLALRPGLRLDLLRLPLFLGFIVFAAFSQALAILPLSLPSYLMLIVLYLPFALRLELGPPAFRGVIALFLDVMLLAAALIGLQAALRQWAGITLSLESWVPSAWLLKGYIYAAPAAWGAVRPNGLVFLEASFASIFAATALILEWQHFRRRLRLLAYGLALLATFGASGLVMLAVAAPLLLLRLPAMTLLLLALCTAFGTLCLWSTGALDPFLIRLGEFGRPGSSGFLRLVLPARQLLEASGERDLVFGGHGAGNAPIGSASAWPAVKLALEYGFVAMALLLGFVLHASANRANAALVLALLVLFNFVGGYLHEAPVVLLLVLFGALLQRRDQAAVTAPKIAAPTSTRAGTSSIGGSAA